jgi:hypothetical protein
MSQDLSFFDSHMTQGQFQSSGEDWEDWLRWDPAVESTSPEDTASHSTSSKDASPMQAHVFPAGDGLFDKNLSNSLSPVPVIVGSDGTSFSPDQNYKQRQQPFLFGHQDDSTSVFDFAQTEPFIGLQPQASYSRLDTNTAGWNLPSATNALSDHASSVTSVDPKSGLLATPSTATPTHSYINSPESTSNKRSSLSSNSPEPPKKRGGRKRKAESPTEAGGEAMMIEGMMQDGDEPPVKKTSHNVIEKRYRNNLNDKIIELRNSVPSLRAKGRAKGSEDLDGLTAAHKLNKATVMAKATEYIHHLEKRNEKMADEMATLKARLAAVETALGRDGSQSAGSSPGSTASRKASSASQSGPSAFLNVPSGELRYIQPVTSQQYRSQQSAPTYARAPNPPVDAQNSPKVIKAKGGLANKVMLGAMAGIMVMEGAHEQQSSGDRSLAAVPIPLFRRAVDGQGMPLARQAVLPLIKVALVVGVMLYVFVPFLLSFSGQKKQKTRTAIRLPQAPSLASPVEVRRKAWLTAIQSVWVPKHFLLEVVAVCTKMIQLSVRRLIGSEAFTSITGTSKEEEAARIKAWDIAIDAQLAGGDAQVSYYRLLLTLMESGTLPDSPVRLMQKAVHFRVFFWDLANIGYGNFFGFKRFTEKVGAYYWDSARKLQKDLIQAQQQGRPSDSEDDNVELLPDHLAMLLELECDEVLGDEMIQRAWNLAWNKPSAHGTIANPARDSVVEDHAIRSPLDAVAAWYANATIDTTLADALLASAEPDDRLRAASTGTSCLDTEYYIGLALRVAPSASHTHVRALAAKAVLSTSNRDANIVAALEALPVLSSTMLSATTSNGTMTPNAMNLVPHTPASPDICTALTLAKLISLLSTPTSSAAARSSRARAHNALADLDLPSQHQSLLTAVATYRLLRVLGKGRSSIDNNTTKGHNRNPSSPTGKAAQHTLLPRATITGIENLAASLRIWIGSGAASVSSESFDERDAADALSPAGPSIGVVGALEREIVVRMCVEVGKKFGGWDEQGRDSGYGSEVSGSERSSPISGGSRLVSAGLA